MVATGQLDCLTGCCMTLTNWLHDVFKIFAVVAAMQTVLALRTYRSVSSLVKWTVAGRLQVLSRCQHQIKRLHTAQWDAQQPVRLALATVAGSGSGPDVFTFFEVEHPIAALLIAERCNNVHLSDHNHAHRLPRSCCKPYPQRVGQRRTRFASLKRILGRLPVLQRPWNASPLLPQQLPQALQVLRAAILAS